MLNDKATRDRILAEVKSEMDPGLVGLIPAYGPDGQELDSEEHWTMGERPTPEQIDRTKTSDDQILDGRAILKDGTRRAWK